MASDNINSSGTPQSLPVPDTPPRTGIFNKFENTVHRISDWIRWISISFLLIMMLFVTVDVISRYTIGKTIKGDLELQELMMVLIVFLAFPYCTMRKRNIYVELLIERLKGRTKAIVSSFASLVGMAILSVIIWQTALRGWEGVTGSQHELTLLLNIPLAPFMLIAAVGLAFMGLEWLIYTVHTFTLAIGKQAG